MAEEKKPKFPKTLFIILLLIIIIAGIVFVIRMDWAPQIIKEQYQKASSYLKESFKFVTHPEEKLAKFGEWKTETQAVEKEKPKGVIISDFRSKKPLYEPEKSVETTSLVDIYGLEERDTIVKFECKTKDDEGVVLISGMEDNEIYVPAGGQEFAGVNCEFEDGFDEGNYKIKLRALYEDFVSRGELKVYTLEEEKQDELRLKKTSAFNYYSIKESLLNKDKGLMKSTYTYGPLRLTMGLISRQPVSEEGIYDLSILIEEDKSGWKGELDKIKSLKLILPYNLDVTEDCAFGEDLSLDENEIEEYKLKDGEIELWCKFVVNEAGEDLTFSVIRLQANYDYVFEKETSVEVKSRVSS